MKTIKRLLAVADDEGIGIVPVTLKQNAAIAIQYNDGDYIVLDRRRTRPLRQRKVALAHEIGHHLTGSLYFANSPFETRERCENRANRWAIRELLPLDELRAAARQGITEPWELAEHFEVTEDFVRRALAYYDACGIICKFRRN